MLIPATRPMSLHCLPELQGLEIPDEPDENLPEHLPTVEPTVQPCTLWDLLEKEMQASIPQSPEPFRDLVDAFNAKNAIEKESDRVYNIDDDLAGDSARVYNLDDDNRQQMVEVAEFDVDSPL